MDIIGLLRKPEGKTLEFSRDLSSPNPFIRSVAAFSNTSGGTILIGVEDCTRNVLDVADPIALEERVASLIADSISPQVLPDIEILRYSDRHLVAVRVYPSASRPHVVGVHPDTGVYVRIGSNNHIADEQLIAEMRRYANREAFDERSMPELDSEAIDFRAASESFAEFRRLTQRDLDILRMCATHQGRRVPTVGGVLLFGRDRLAHFPDAWIQVGRFAGIDKSNILDGAELSMLLVDAIPAAVAFIERHMASGVVIGPVRRSHRWTVPPIAVREALVNAVVHTDYSQLGAPIRVAIFDDRLEIENPGLLPFGITLDDLPRGVSKLRNRVIGRVFHELGLVEQWGSGIQRMISACKEAGLAAPVWEEIGTRLRVTIFTERVHQSPTDSIDRRIVDMLDIKCGLGTSEIAKAIGRSTRATRSRLKRLVERGLVVEIGTSPRDPNRKYYRSGD